MKTYLKTLVQMFTKHITRFLSIIFMVLLSAGFISGLGSTADKIDDSLTKLYIDANVGDFTVKSKEGGFDEDALRALKERYGEENIETGAAYDVHVFVGEEKQLVRLTISENNSQNINRLTSVEKSDSPEAAYPVKAERRDKKIKGIPLGTNITLDFEEILKELIDQSEKTEEEKETEKNNLELMFSSPYFPEKDKSVTVTVTETAGSPLLFAMDCEPSYTNPPDTEIPDNIADVNKLIGIDNALYLTKEMIPAMLQSRLGTGDLSIALKDRSAFGAFSPEYKKLVDTEKNFLERTLGADKTEVLTLYDNYSFYSLHSYADKVMGITVVLMIAFLLVTILLVLSTMTRLFDEERAQIATLCTLGYSGAKILFKYLLFAALATGIGGVAGYFVGFGVMNLLYFVFNYSFAMPPMAPSFTIVFFLITFIAIAVSTLSATAIAGGKLVREKPAALLCPKAPKAGKKVFLERIPFLWKLLSFRHKSTVRNVLRYMGRFLMTVVSVAFSMALMMAGLAILDLCLFHGFNDASLLAVALVVAVFASLISAVVIYTLTSINISERQRELATLKVLGYHNSEVAGYIYREVYLDTAIGLVFGYPLSVLLVYAIFKVIGGLGTLGGVSWFVWLIAPLLILGCTALVTLILRRKIVKIDMNDSLKANE